MSAKVYKSYADPIMISDPTLGGTFGFDVTVPTDGTEGWAPNALFVDLDATGPTGLYVNTGTLTSCAFRAVNGGLATGAGAGITSGVGTVYENSVQLSGGIYYTRILIDLTGLESSTTDLDIIGVGTSPAYIGQITAAQNGTILSLKMTCLEVPAGGADDVDLYAATEATGVFDAGIATLAETAIVSSGAAWAANDQKIATAVVAPNKYLYLTGGEAGTAATYTAGQFLIEMWGY